MARIITPNVNLPKLKGIHLRVEFPDTGIVVTDRWEEAHSWVHNAYSAANAFMGLFVGSGVNAYNYGPGDRFSRTLAGLLRSYTSYANVASWGSDRVDAGLAEDQLGIVVGTGDADFHLMRYDLDGRVRHGTGSGQLVHNAQPTRVQGYDSATKKYTTTIKRVFNNNSGASITVNCVGLVGHIGIYYSVPEIHLLTYDKLDSGVTIPDAGQLTVSYEIESQPCDWLDIYNWPAIGESGFGGTVIGYRNPWEIMVLAPKSGGESLAVSFSDPYQTTTPVQTDAAGDEACTSALIGLGSASEIGQFCSAARSAELGGYDDWLIPSLSSLRFIGENQDSLPAGEEVSAVEYWSCERKDDNEAYTVNMGGSPAAWADPIQTSDCALRLVRIQTIPLAS